MSFHTFNCLACYIMANSEKIKLSKWRSNNPKESPKRNIKAVQSISTNENIQEVT